MKFVRCVECGQSDRLPVGMDESLWRAMHSSMACKKTRAEKRPQVLTYVPIQKARRR